MSAVLENWKGLTKSMSCKDTYPGYEGSGYRSKTVVLDLKTSIEDDRLHIGLNIMEWKGKEAPYKFYQHVGYMTLTREQAQKLVDFIQKEVLDERVIRV